MISHHKLVRNYMTQQVLMDHEALGLCTCTSRNVTSLLQADCLYRLYVNEARFRAKTPCLQKDGLDKK